MKIVEYFNKIILMIPIMCFWWYFEFWLCIIPCTYHTNLALKFKIKSSEIYYNSYIFVDIAQSIEWWFLYKEYISTFVKELYKRIQIYFHLLVGIREIEFTNVLLIFEMVYLIGNITNCHFRILTWLVLLKSSSHGD